MLETILDGEIPLPPEPEWPEELTMLPRNGSRPVDKAAQDDDGGLDGAVDGASFILDQPAGVAAIWGRGPQVLWAAGEALMIAGPQGLGKTTLAGLLIRALLLGGDVLGLPVTRLDGRVLYLAMDRPRQIARSLARQFTEADRAVLADRLVVRPGPPPADLSAQPLLLAGLAERYDAGVVFVDSLKDAAVGLSDDAVAASYNRARQHLLAAGRQVGELHHTVKRNSRGETSPTAVDAIYGSTWLTSGAGSIVMLSGEPGDPIVGFRHVKQPAEEVGPYRLLHDQAAGLLSVEHSVDLVALVEAGGPDGLTARAAAAAITEKNQPSRADVEKARRKLEGLAAAGTVARLDGARGGGELRTPTLYFPAHAGNHGQARSEENPQVRGNHGLFGDEDAHADHTAITPVTDSAGQDHHGTNHGNNAARHHVSPGPYKGAGERSRRGGTVAGESETPCQ